MPKKNQNRMSRVDEELKKEIIELLSQNGHGPKIKRLRCWAWPMKLTKLDRKIH